jgi:hypothetical protein
MNIPTSIRAGLCLAALLCWGPAWAAASADQAHITHLMKQQFDKPEAPLTVAPVVVKDDHAIASWAQGERGGRALLRRYRGQWEISVCAGDGLTDPQVLQTAGLTSPQAQSLAKALAHAEARLPAAQRAKFSTFDGLLRLGAGGHHPPAHGAPGAGH